MRKIVIALIGLALASNVAFAKKVKAPKLTSRIDSVSYAIGENFAQGISDQLSRLPGGDKLNKELVSQAFNKVFAGDSTFFKQDAAMIILNSYFMEEEEKKAADARKTGQDFLVENAKRSGVVVLPSGLQYEVITPGLGAKPQLTDRVTVHYHGTLIDGTVFDSSVNRNQPATFGLQQVIKGWTEALQLMPVGSKWRIYIPENLGYGSRAAGSIPPYSTLIFEVELLSIAE